MSRPLTSVLRRTALLALALSPLSPLSPLSMAAAQPALAQEPWPSRTITIVVPYPPGGSNDLFARMVGKAIGESMKATVVIDNRSGASGSIGAGMVAKAQPDGYTLVAVSSSITTNAAVQTAMPFDVVTSFAPVATFAKGPFIVAVNNDVPAHDPSELIALLKKDPGKLNYASSGPGSSNQFATEMLKAASGTQITHVPYRGMAPAVTGLIGGETELLIASGPSLLPQVRNGKIRAIGITSAEPSPIAPDLVPMASVAPGYSFELWWGLLAPAGTPPAIVEKLNAEVNKAITSSELKEAFLKEGAVAAPMAPAEFARVIATEVGQFKDVAKRQGIVAQ